MPISVDLELGPSSLGLRAPNPNQLHGWACTLLEETDEEHTSGEKPWAIRPPRIRDGAIQISLTWLDDDHRPSVFEDGIERTIRFGPSIHPVLRVRGRESSWHDMAEVPWNEVVVAFESPTWFSRNGRRYPFPDPVLACRRLASRWLALADADFPDADAFDRLMEQVELVDVAGETRGFLTGKSERVGFVGEMTLRVKRGDEMAGTALASAWRLAELCGVGAQTTYGAGSVRIIRSREQ